MLSREQGVQPWVGTRMEKGSYQAASQWPELCGFFHHAVKSDPHKELLGALQSEQYRAPCLM